MGTIGEFVPYGNGKNERLVVLAIGKGVCVDHADLSMPGGGSSFGSQYQVDHFAQSVRQRAWCTSAWNGRMLCVSSGSLVYG